MRPRSVPAKFFTIMLVVAAVLAFIWARMALGQTLPASLGGFCGSLSVATPITSQVATGAVYASAAVTNTPSSPVIPTLTQGSLVGMLAFVEIAPIRVRVDGGIPTTLAGMQYGPSPAPGGAFFITCGSDLARLQYVAASAAQGNATVHQWFYGVGR